MPLMRITVPLQILSSYKQQQQQPVQLILFDFNLSYFSLLCHAVGQLQGIIHLTYYQKGF